MLKQWFIWSFLGGKYAEWRPGRRPSVGLASWREAKTLFASLPLLYPPVPSLASGGLSSHRPLLLPIQPPAAKAGLSCCHFLVQWPRPPPRHCPRFCTCGPPGTFPFFCTFLFTIFFGAFFLKLNVLWERLYWREQVFEHIFTSPDSPVFGNQTAGILADSAG